MGQLRAEIMGSRWFFDSFKLRPFQSLLFFRSDHRMELSSRPGDHSAGAPTDQDVQEAENRAHGSLALGRRRNQLRQIRSTWCRKLTIERPLPVIP
jgi:hypothetical protein